MRFEVRTNEKFWEVGFYKHGTWVCLSAYNTQSEADVECKRLRGGNL